MTRTWNAVTSRRKKNRAHEAKKLTKVSPQDTNSFVGDSLKPADGAGWDDLDQAFFASAPPDVPELPPEPERFDDLFPGAPVEKKREMPVALRRASAALHVVTGRTRPAIAAVGRLTGAAWRTSSRALTAVGQGALRTTRPAAARVVAVLRGRRLNGQAVAIAFASVILITGLSAVIVAASRSNAHANLPATPLERRAASTDRPTVAEAVTPAPLPYAPPTEAPPTEAPPAEAPPAEAPVASPAPVLQSTPVQSTVAEPEVATATPSSSTEHHKHAEPAKRPAVATPAPAHKHRKAPSYSAERDLMVPSFVTQPAAPQAAPPAKAPAPRPAAPPIFARPPAPANTPPPGPAARPMFSR
jgi:hypothetical protein